MRISGHRRLKTPSGLATRPTSARVREALFNIWQGGIAECRWLDLCAGTGAIGAEALSRGAAFVLGIEQSSRACSIIQQNWQQVAKPGQHFQVIRGDVVQRLKTLQAGQAFDRIYFDPPYASNLYQPVIEAIADHQLLTPNGEMVVEHSPQQLPQSFQLVMSRQKVYGNTALTFYCVDSSEAIASSTSTHP